MFGKHQHETEKSDCLRCQYNSLIKEGKIIIDGWDKQPPTPERLVEIQQILAKLQSEIEEHKNDAELKFCADHPEIFEFLPIEV
ncbi:hypothetical protein [Spiroplasma endosymbiont of Virgichneumon dumeticola]|uniref:hypothetical protein n=1 Tax=Spiroplasma endosymbiont of Virgichneumon dumeticola TaxID=3139323 RepID=UPI0035C8936B